jgi:glycosyltransferase involved in cell wall biosynthesis
LLGDFLKIGILVVAYNAESTIKNTISRIPKSFLSSINEILISDDKSSDSTTSVAQELKMSSRLPITVVTQPINLGYGGNQKFGYFWAIENKWDIVILLHADGQYAPEFIEAMVQPILVGYADVVFGSRMMDKKSALKGGMPKYKWIGNQILTTIQNLLTNQLFSEWHSGYRAYRVASLQQLPLARLNNGFRFDTQIILELLNIKARFKEISIPTFYGDEVSHVNGLEYAREIIWDTFKYRRKHGVSGGSKLGNKS